MCKSIYDRYIHIRDTKTDTGGKATDDFGRTSFTHDMSKVQSPLLDPIILGFSGLQWYALPKWLMLALS